MIGIYKITNPKGKIYIGQSVNIHKRLLQYKNGTCIGQTKLYRSLNKYGFNNHIIEIVEECLQSELNQKEIYYIELFQCFNSQHGLNLKAGGDGGGKCSDETKSKISIKNTGRKASKEAKEKMSIAHSGKNNVMYGKNHSESTRTKISLNRTGLTVGEKNGMFGKTHTKEVRSILRTVNKGIHSRGKHLLARKVKNTTTNKIFNCAKDAWESMGGNKFGIYGGGSYSHFIACLAGTWRNKTPFIYID